MAKTVNRKQPAKAKQSVRDKEPTPLTPEQARLCSRYPDPEGEIETPWGVRYRVATEEDMCVLGARLRCPVGQPLTREETEDIRREFRARQSQQSPQEDEQEQADDVPTSPGH